jgi:hypothetical protein
MVATAGGPPFVVAADFTLGGVGHDRLTDLVVDASGNAYVAGVVGSYNFPGIDSGAVTNAGVDMRFVAKLAPLARDAAFIAVVGSPTPSLIDARSAEFGEMEAAGLAVDAGGNALLVAYESAKDYPAVGGAYVGTSGRKYVYKVSPSGTVTRLSLPLDPAINRVGAIAVDAVGAIYLTGSARDGLQTTAGAPYPTSSVTAGCIAPYAMKLDATGQTVRYATYLGNSGAGASICGGKVPQPIRAIYVHPTGHALAIDALGNAYITGQAEPGLAATSGSPDYGTKIVGPTGYNNLIIDPASHAFVTKLNATGTAITYTARLGGSLRDRGTGIVVDATGAAIVAGKTSSRDFPVYPGAIDGPAFVTYECTLGTPERGFVAKIAPDGKQLVFSGYLPLDGVQLDDCSGYGAFNPAKVAIDSSGNVYAAGYTTASNRVFHATPDAIIPDSTGYQTPIGNQALQVFSPDGQRKLYSTALPRFGVQGIAVDPWQNVIIANNTGVQRLSTGALPVELAAIATPACAGKTISLVARVAATNDLGTVDFAVDGTSIGSAAILSGNATRSTTLAAGIHRANVSYHGAGAFDGYVSPDLYFAINQAGSCP